MVGLCTTAKNPYTSRARKNLHARETFFASANATFRALRPLTQRNYVRDARTRILQGADWISTASGSERPSTKASLATARGTDSSPQIIFGTAFSKAPYGKPNNR
jgi:hypothetical protein